MIGEWDQSIPFLPISIDFTSKLDAAAHVDGLYRLTPPIHPKSFPLVEQNTLLRLHKSFIRNAATPAEAHQHRHVLRIDHLATASQKAVEK